MRFPERLVGRLAGAPKLAVFVLVGLLGFVIDLIILFSLYGHGFSLSFAHIMSGLTAFGTGYALDSVRLFKDAGTRPTLRGFSHFVVIALSVLFLRGGILASLTQLLDFSPGLAILICVIASSILYFIGTIYSSVFLQASDDDQIPKKWVYFFVGVVIYSVLLRLFYLGVPELFYEEAYYWNYAQHLDIGYLDHPPLVAWIIALFTHLMGDHEFAVRFGAFICWFITAGFSWKLARDIHKESGVSQTLLLVATLPIYFATGWAMTPDAPLMACWAASLYFLYQALIHERRMAWLGVGVAMGLGMLAKYTMALLGVAALLFILVDRHSRKWFFRPEPYLAVVVALVLFLPVIVWNADHAWASFFYQGRDRMADHFEFSLPDFIASIILILTPTGLLSVILVLLFRKNFLVDRAIAFRNTMASAVNRSDRLISVRTPHPSPPPQGGRESERSHRLQLVLALFPVAVFAALSLFRETKFHWTGPCWLAILPYLALVVVQNPRIDTHRFLGWIQRAWPPTIMICLLGYGAFLHYLALGFPGIPYPQRLYLLGWQGFGREIEALVDQFERDTGEKLLVVGMDRNRIASGLAFYRTRAVQSANQPVDRHPALETASWHLFGMKSLMYEYWFPIEAQNNKNLLLVSRDIANLTSDHVRSHVRQVGDIKEITLWKNGKQAGRYYYCLAKAYRSGFSADPTTAIMTTDR